MNQFMIAKHNLELEILKLINNLEKESGVTLANIGTDSSRIIMGQQSVTNYIRLSFIL